MIFALITLAKALYSRIHSGWLQYQPALHKSVSAVWEKSLLVSNAPSQAAELTEYGNYIQAIYDEVHRFAAALTKGAYPLLWIDGYQYVIQRVEFQSDQLWYYCFQRKAPFVQKIFHQDVDMIWHMVLTSVNEPRHPYFANRS